MMHRFHIFWDQFLLSQEILLSLVMLPGIAKILVVCPHNDRASVVRLSIFEGRDSASDSNRSDSRSEDSGIARSDMIFPI